MQQSTQSPNATAVVACSGLTKVYGSGDAQVDALTGIDASFPRGEFTAVMGPSGSGKSTLMHILAGLDEPTAGSVQIDGIELTELGDKELTRLRRDKVGFVFQAFNLLPMLTAGENIDLPLKLAGRQATDGVRARVIAAIGLGDRLDHRPAELSGGQQQRVAVARALVTQPAVLFADEPTGNLDSRSGSEVLSLMRRAVDEDGQTIIMVTHDPRAASNADRIIFLQDGAVVRDERGLDQDAIFELVKGLE